MTQPTRLAMFLVALMVAVVACAPATRITTGSMLYGIGEQFLQTAKLYDRALAEKAITSEQYHEFDMFASSFQHTFARLYESWQSGGDPVEIRKQLEELRLDLEIYALKVAKK